jgi:hypothetical protein
MKFVIAFILLLNLVGCKKKTETIYQPYEVTTTVVEETTKEVEVEKIVEVEVDQPLEGVYEFENGGYLELIVDHEGYVTILDEDFNLVVVNSYNDTLANMPRVTAENVPVRNNKFTIAKDVNYGNTNQYDLERDDNGQNITGVRYTVLEFSLTNDDVLEILIKVYDGRRNNNLNWVIFETTLRGY